MPSPRMKAALRDGADLVWFADVHLNVQTAICDSATDWGNARASDNVDIATEPGFVRLATTGTGTLSQASQNTDLALGYTARIDTLHQTITLPTGRVVTSVVLRVNNDTGGTASATVAIVSGSSASGTILKQVTISGIGIAYAGEVTADFGELSLEAGTYGILVRPLTNNLKFQYQNTDVYSGGQLDRYVWTLTFITGGASEEYAWLLLPYATNIGDLYFKVNYQGFEMYGSIDAPTIDAGRAPLYPGTFMAAYQQPAGTSVRFTLKGSDTGAFSGEETTYQGIRDGDAVGAFYFWQIRIDLTSSPDQTRTPIIDMVSIVTPRDIIRMRSHDKKMDRADTDLLSAFSPLLTGVSYQASEIKPPERIASGGAFSATVRDPGGEVVRRIVALSPLKNHRAIVYLGANVPGFCENDLLRHFIGSVDTGSIAPAFGQREAWELKLSIKNTIYDLKRKVPLPTSTGLLASDDVYMAYDGDHVMDVAMDLLRNEANLPARYVELEDFEALKYSIGDSELGAANFIVKRTSGSPDRRVKGPVELNKLLEQIAALADIYVFPKDNGRIGAVKHGTSATPDAYWADRLLVSDGLNYTPIHDIAEIDLGLGERLFNLAMMGCEWDGDGEEWKDFSKVFAYVAGASVEAFAPGVEQYLKPMEANLKAASQWLGPESGYNGELIAQNLAKRYSNRFAWPPVILRGVVVPQGELERSAGSEVWIASDNVCSFRRSRVPSNDLLKCIVLSMRPTVWRNRNMAVADVMELT